MSDDEYIEIQNVLDQARNAGLDLKRSGDMGFYQSALDEYRGNDMNRDMPQIMEAAAAKKRQSQTATQGLDDYFQVFREQERQKASKNTPKPQPKTNTEKTATEGLNDYFSDFRKKQGY